MTKTKGTYMKRECEQERSRQRDVCARNIGRRREREEERVTKKVAKSRDVGE